MIKVLVNGARGKMGQATVKAVWEVDGLELVGETDVDDNLALTIIETNPDVVVDFTHPNNVKDNAITIINASSCPVIGTTGLSDPDMAELDMLARKKNTGVLVCPNFAIGAILMMKYAQEAAKHLDTCEIIEYHHENKVDAPSGTAIKSAQLIYEANKDINNVEMNEKELVKGARGGKQHQIPVHSVRLQGFVASQEIIFGGLGQTLKIRHDTISRESFMPGVIMAIKKVQDFKGLVYGLDNILF
ncbi:MAG: 4-hydroxy-tetrahydrodipicolinate reductase [bacterium]|nr:4-hydroxy-tetrahydrodipicolinate reductase [bacterium]